MEVTVTTTASSSSDGPLMRSDIPTIVQEVVRHLQPAGQENTPQLPLAPGMLVIIYSTQLPP